MHVRASHIAAASISLLLIAVVAWSIRVITRYWIEDTQPQTTQAAVLRQVDQLLAAVALHSGEPMPDELPGYLRVTDDCWQFLQEQMIRNHNRYTRQIAQFHDSRTDPYPVHDIVEVWIDLYFPDGTSGEVYSLQGGLNGCKAH